MPHLLANQNAILIDRWGFFDEGERAAAAGNLSWVDFDTFDYDNVRSGSGSSLVDDFYFAQYCQAVGIGATNKESKKYRWGNVK